MNFKIKMYTNVRNDVHKNIHEHLKYKLFAVIESQVSSELITEIDSVMVRSTAPSLIVMKCWSYEF